MKYTVYNLNQRVLIKSTGEQGEAFESALGFTSVFIDGEDTCRYFSDEDVLFLNSDNSQDVSNAQE